jgi:hypothetical protein
MAQTTMGSGIEARDDVAVYDRAATYNETTMIAPTDRIRWGSVLAGLFAALSTLVILSLLGLAIGMTTYDPGDPLSSFGIGAGIWGAISTILAFLIGGWLAARTAAVRGRSNGILNGIMVWVVAIPLILYFLGSGLGSIMNMATDAAATGASVAVSQVADQPAAEGTAQNAAGQAQAQATAVAGQITPQNVENVADTAGSATWGTLIALLIGLASAAVGGLLGARDRTAYSPA